MKPPHKQIHEMNIEEINDFIHYHLPIKKVEKDTYGEVFTPSELINKMLDGLPKKVWTTPSLKWLEPNNGIGNFMMIVYVRLMEGLEHWETNKQKRSNHIIQHMLYMVEINEANCKIAKQLFGPKANLFCEDFLSWKPSILFDCIVGNPPFQDPVTNKHKTGSKSKLYERILLKSIECLRPGGFLAFITPDNLFSGKGVIGYRALLKEHVSFVSLNEKNKQYFPNIQQYICYFVMEKLEDNSTQKDRYTVIENNKGDIFRVVLQERPINPVRNWTFQTEKLIDQYISNVRNKVVYNRGHPISSYKGNKYPIIYKPKVNVKPEEKLYTNEKTQAIGLGIPKIVIFVISPQLAFETDYDGKYGVGPNTFYVPVKNILEKNKIENFLKSDDYKTMALSTKTSRQFLKIGFIEYLDFDKIVRFNGNKTRKQKTKKNTTQKRKK